jgi:hypothetical protein
VAVKGMGRASASPAATSTSRTRREARCIG